MLKNRLLVALLQKHISDLDPRSPISFLTSLAILPYLESLIKPVYSFLINFGCTQNAVAFWGVLKNGPRALGFSRSLALMHFKELPKLLIMPVPSACLKTEVMRLSKMIVYKTIELG